jgi:hypothetical protein
MDGDRRVGGASMAPGLHAVAVHSAPPSQVSARRMPRLVQVTTIDSARFMLERARVLPGDTLTGRSVTAADSEPPIRIPGSQIAHLEARVPTIAGAIRGAGLVLGGTALFPFLVGRAGDSGTP